MKRKVASIFGGVWGIFPKQMRAEGEALVRECIDLAEGKPQWYLAGIILLHGAVYVLWFVIRAAFASVISKLVS